MITLRNYQEKCIEDLRDGYRSGFTRQILCAPVAAGKTVLFSVMTRNAAAKGLRTMIVTHRQELLSQASNTLTMVGVPHGLIQSGTRTDNSRQVQVASIGTLVRRLDEVTPPDFLIFDEAHHCAASQWVSVFAQYPKAKVLGVTATPCRLDGRGLSDFFQNLVMGPKVSWLIEQGYLAKPTYWAPNQDIDFSGVHKVAGDFSSKETADIMDKRSITGDAADTYLQRARGKKFIGFVITLKHAENSCEEFKSRGIRCEVIDGKLSDYDRKKRISDLELGAERGGIDGLISCNLISEGTDIPAVSAIVILRPTQSLGLHVQMLGRGSRRKELDNTFTVLDHCGNCVRLGLLEEDREWSLDGSAAKKRTKEAILDTRRCEKCYAVFLGTECPQCGTQRESKARQIEQREGELRQLEASQISARRLDNIKIGTAKSYAELAAIGKAKGYASGWAYFRWKASRNNPMNRRKRAKEEVLI